MTCGMDRFPLLTARRDKRSHSALRSQKIACSTGMLHKFPEPLSLRLKNTFLSVYCMNGQEIIVLSNTRSALLKMPQLARINFPKYRESLKLKLEKGIET